MKTERILKTTKTLMTAALILQGVYLLNIALITLCPKLFFAFYGPEHYDLPVPATYLIGAAIATLLFILLYAVMLGKVKGNRRLGTGSSVALGIYIYGMYFCMDTVLGRIYSMKISAWIDQGVGGMTATAGENVAGASLIGSYCNLAKIWFFTAIVLMTAAHGIYRFYCSQEGNEG